MNAEDYIREHHRGKSDRELAFECGVSIGEVIRRKHGMGLPSDTERLPDGPIQ